jgi:hypothetical protein
MLGPDVWGPHGWKFIHYVTLAYPNNPTKEEKENYKEFFHAIGNVLPCSICSNHYKENISMMPLTDDILSSKDKVINWAIDMHNRVNASRKKKIYTYHEARKLINDDEECESNKYVETFGNTRTSETIHTSETNEDKTTNMLYIGGIIFILIAIAIIYKKK